MILLIPMIGPFMPSQVIIFISKLSDSLLDFSVVFDGEAHIIDRTTDIDYSQKYWYYNLIDLSSSSSMINTEIPLILMICTIPLTIVINWLYMKIRDKNKKDWWTKLIVKSHKFMIFTFYIRAILEHLILYSLASFDEINRFDTSSNTRIISLTVSILIIWMLASFCILNLVLWLCSRDLKNYGNEYFFKELFQGIKKNYWIRTYMLIFILRRLVFVGIVIFLGDVIYQVKLGLLWAIQCIYMSCIIVFRFHEQWDHNLNEAINEVWYFVLIVSLWFLNKEDDWNFTLNLWYIYFIFANCVINLIITIIASVRNYIKSRKKKSVTEVINPSTIVRQSESMVKLNRSKTFDFNKGSKSFKRQKTMPSNKINPKRLSSLKPSNTPYNQSNKDNNEELKLEIESINDKNSIMDINEPDESRKVAKN